ncbi:MarR family winged helix-turn-helix transcriptional regulator [Streptomyces coeruleorubidus]|uniref:MarR family winged helix-turn-helix transcriptional regulator n=1 Tax=Streptomyces coeruleorubidus TaxID=116188 RepID=UPI0033BDFD60
MARRPQELLHLLTRAERLAVRRLQSVLAEFDCSVEAWRVLHLLSDGQGHNMTALADHAFLPAPTLTKLIDQLVDQNLVYRRVDPADRRRILAHLTPRGMERWQRLAREVRADWAEPDPLPKNDDDQLGALLDQLAHALEGKADAAGPVTTARGVRAVGRAR